MTTDGRGQPTVVRLAGCRCPGSPHPDGDTVTLRGDLTAEMGIAAAASVRGLSDTADIQARLAGVWLRYGVMAWSFTDEKGEPVPVTPAAVLDELQWDRGGYEVVQAADEVYSDRFFYPLAPRTSTPSAPTPTDGSTSPSSPSGSSLPTPSSPSSPPASADGTGSEVPVQ